MTMDHEQSKQSKPNWAANLLAELSHCSTSELVKLGRGPMSISELLDGSLPPNTQYAALITLAYRALLAGNEEARGGLIQVACTGKMYENVNLATKLLCVFGRLEDFSIAAPQMFDRSLSVHPGARPYYARRFLWMRHAVSNLGADIVDFFPKESRGAVRALIARGVEEENSALPYEKRQPKRPWLAQI